ncbi:hypothetical protein LSH36_9g15015 [Paralvinella palmiformis]|uniref:Uncharacterized protein n=1 Tax=Paralvinella palmiformis TaxID=53620 RepID=A0AAD9NIH5_9ANNE|nr:hypothetical protein LSH36_9g15015 [Paralvinella palmiformis]
MTILTKYRTLMPISLMMDRTISFHMQRHLGSSVIFSNFLHSGSSQSSNANDLNGHNLNRSLICGRSTRHTSSHTNSAYSTSRRYVLTPHIWITHSAVFKYSTSVFIPQNTTISVCNLSFRDHLFFVQKKFKHTKKSTWSSEEHEVIIYD